jgi:hypothetical protein
MDPTLSPAAASAHKPLASGRLPLGRPAEGPTSRKTKVNRCLTEGRKAFLARVEGIEAGAECERPPVISRIADGEASPAELRAARPHLRTCLTCRARLRAFRAAPAQVAALLPPLAAAAHLDGDGSPLAAAESLLGALSDRLAAL